MSEREDLERRLAELKKQRETIESPVIDEGNIVQYGKYDEIPHNHMIIHADEVKEGVPITIRGFRYGGHIGRWGFAWYWNEVEWREDYKMGRWHTKIMNFENPKVFGAINEPGRKTSIQFQVLHRNPGILNGYSPYALDKVRSSTEDPTFLADLFIVDYYYNKGYDAIFFVWYDDNIIDMFADISNGLNVTGKAIKRSLEKEIYV